MKKNYYRTSIIVLLILRLNEFTKKSKLIRSALLNLTSFANRKPIKIQYISVLVIISNILNAQLSELGNLNLGEVHGNFQTDAQYYVADSSIGAKPAPEKMLMNGFANIIYTKGKFTAGIRYESYLNVRQGFDSRYQGTGIPYRYATYKSDQLEVTVGSFYQQFGNGFILRSYEDRGLGFDNALDGIRLKYEVFKGIYLTGLTGKQRSFMTQGPGIVRGFDGEIQLNDAIKYMSEKKLIITIGGSFVSRYQKDENQTLVLPENVGASAARFKISRNNFAINGEYAYKINDPNAANGYVYKPGEAILLAANYAKKGLAISASASRTDNMNFRSDREASVNNLLINYTPALCKQHTYSLMSFYPYSSQPNGEYQFSGEVSSKILKKSNHKLDITLNYSGSNNLDTTHLNHITDSTLQGYQINSYNIGKTLLYRDFYIEVNQKFGKKIKLSVMYSHQQYNNKYLKGASDAGSVTIYSHIAVADITYKIKSEKAIRIELQHLSTKQDKQNWAYALAEYTINSNWFVAVLDQYNYGNKHADANGSYDKRFHYYNLSAGYNKNANRITLSYGKQRAGIFCVGGICRQVPASNGITLSITSSF